MKLITKYITLILIFQIIKTKCSSGCLVCVEDDECLLCDFTNAYYLNGSECFEDTNGNCKIYYPTSNDGRCLHCEEEHYVDLNGKCVLVQNDIPNCAAYHNEGTCHYCDPTFHIEGNSCERVENPIDHCKIHDSADPTFCDECFVNYVLTVDEKRCEGDPDTRFCAHYTFIECLECKPATAIHYNAYLDDFKEFILKKEVDELNSTLVEYLTAGIDLVTTNQCQPISIPNCIRRESDTACGECAGDYFVNPEGTCTRNPTEPLGNCSIYTDLTKCHTCDQGFHLNTDFTCIRNGEITDCVLFDGSTFETTCILCNDEHYLVNNKCTDRDNTGIVGCETYSITEDKCAKCEGDRLVTTDGLKCLNKIDECVDYINSTINSINHICNQCKEGFYISGGDCVEGTVEFCAVYMDNTETCVRCLEEYVLSGEECVVRQTTIDFCELYNATIDDACEKCETSSILADLDESCKPLEPIPECNTYSNFETCSECNEFYELINNECESIPTDENCKKKVNGLCTLCLEGYYNDNGVCKKIEEKVKENCAVIDQNPTTPNACLECDTQTLPVNTEGVYTCEDPADFPTGAIDHCLKYFIVNDVRTCSRCAETKTVSLDGLSCVDNCANGEVAVIGKLTFDSADANSSVSAGAFRKCESFDPVADSQLEHCKTAAMALNKANNPLVCIECQTGMTATQVCPIELTYFEPSDTTTDEVNPAHIAVECSNNTQATYGKDNSATPNPNCLYHKLNTVGGNPVFTCEACKYGFTGPVHKLADNVYDVVCDLQVDKCDTDFVYDGVLIDSEWFSDIYGFSLPYKFSCFKCDTPNRIPFIHVDWKAQIIEFDIASNPPTSSVTTRGNMVECRAVSAFGLGFDTADFEAFPDNCALGIMNVNRPKKANNTINSSVSCAACKNGFKPVKSTDNYRIIDCTPIDNCDLATSSEEWFNGCRTCSTGFAHEFDNITKRVNYQSCISNTYDNCFAVNNETALCAICQKAYTLSAKGACEQLSSSNCVNFNIMAANSFSKGDGLNQIERAIYFLFDQGCDSCQGGFVNVSSDEEVVHCVESPLLNTDTGYYITSCKAYHLDTTDNSLLCKQCNEGFIPTSDYKICINLANFANCKIAEVGGLACKVCDENYVLVDTSCIEKTIESCTEYLEGQQELKCKTCADTFLLKENECTTGTIPNCLTYNSLTENCSKCKTGFVLIGENGSDNQCVPMPASLNCDEGVLIENGTKFQCNKCEAGHGTTDDEADFPENTCITINTIDFCAKYDYTDDFQSSTFECLECLDTHFLVDGACEERKKIAGCEVFIITEDKCETCLKTYYFDENGECVSLNITTENCSRYDEFGTCVKCIPGNYLKNDECFLVEDLIPQCYEYVSATACAVCLPGYFVQEKLCVKTNATNCKNTIDDKTCASCEEGWYLQLDEQTGNTNCYEADIQECQTYKDNENYCIVCKGHFVVNEDGICIGVTTQIDDCEYYNNETQLCVACAEGYILAANQDKCTFFGVLEHFENCKILKYRKTPLCVACFPGYFFEDGICVDCPASTSYGNGCLYCDYANTSKCLICRTGYYMNTEKKCVINSTLSRRFTNVVESAPTLFNATSLILIISVFITNL